MGNTLCLDACSDTFGSSQFSKSSKRHFGANRNKSAIIPVTVQPLKVNTLVHNLPTQSTAAEPEVANEQSICRRDLTMRDREIIAKCWRKYIQNGRRDIFHKTMLFCIEASPKLNEIIACQHYCYRDLTKWPKLDRICKAQFNFFEKLIYELNMDDRKMREACHRLGETHAQYAQYGMKPHFLDIYHQQLLGLISNLPFEDGKERADAVSAFNRFIFQIIDVMNQAYSQKSSENRTKRQSHEKIAL